ncbi:MAG: sulfatase [Bacteroidota bacterium]|nr:sulfatase [Bacteroidota bacterium]
MAKLSWHHSIVIFLFIYVFQACSNEEKPPNIILVLVDDLGWSDVGFMGSQYYETPNIDHLAKQGMIFTNAYAACAVCSPTRASIMCGKYPARLGITDWIRPWYWRDTTVNYGDYIGDSNRKLLCPANPYWMELEELTIAEVLKNEGYATAHIGKWHLGDKEYFPDKQGFDFNIGGCDIGQAPDYFDPYVDRRMPDGIPTLTPRDSGEYLTDREADEAVQFIRAHSDKAFFLYLCHYAVHTPVTGKEDIIKNFKSKTPVNGQNNPVYASMIKSVDESMGKIVQNLHEMEIADRTIIIFFSDNGGHNAYTSNAPLRSGKGNPYEGGIREPMFVYWPDYVPGNSTCNTPVSSIDFFPTLCRIVGIDIPDKLDIDGIDISPLIYNKGKIERDALFWHFPHYRDYESVTPYSIIRKGNMKLIRFWEGRNELYDLDKDLSETNNLADTFPELSEELNQDIDLWLKKTMARIPRPNPAFQKTD